MMDFNERVIPGVSSNFMLQEELSKYEFTRKYVKRGYRILDLGCGTGYGTAVLDNAIGVDINEEAISFAKKHYGRNSRFFVMDVTKLKFGRESFNLAVSFEVIEHLKDQKKFLKEVKRILKTNSYFILSTPNTSFSSYKSPYHEKEFTFNELYKLLKSEFRKVEIYGQNYSSKAKTAWKDFMRSQHARQNLVNSDLIGIRKLIPSRIKERFWKYFGGFWGRKTQDKLSAKDFPISIYNAKKANDFVAVCQK